MHDIIAQPLTKEAFKFFGEYQDLLDVSEFSRRPGADVGFYPDLMRLNFGTTTLPVINVCRVKKTDEMVVKGAEYHSYTCEGLIPLDGDVIIFVGRPTNAFMKNSGADLKAFIIPRGTFVKFNCGVLHGTQFPTEDGYVNLICMLPERTYANDCERVRYEEEDYANIIYNG